MQTNRNTLKSHGDQLQFTSSSPHQKKLKVAVWKDTNEDEGEKKKGAKRVALLLASNSKTRS